MNGEGAGDCDCSSKATQHVAVEAAIEIAPIPSHFGSDGA
jgi:hypothetical protein